MINYAGAMGAKPPLFSMDGIKGLLSGAGQKLEDGAKTIFAPTEVVQGWQDVFNGIKGGISDAGTAAGQVASTAGAATAGAATAGAVSAGAATAGAGSVGAVASSAAAAPASGFGGWLSKLLGFAPKTDAAAAVPVSALPAVPAVPTVGAVPAAPALGAGELGGPSEINISLKYAQPALAREVTTIRVIRNPITGLAEPVAPADSAVSSVSAGGKALQAGSSSGFANAAGGPIKAQSDLSSGGEASAGAGSSLKQGLEEIGGGMLTAAKNGALFSGVISAVINGFEVLTGKEKVGDGVGGVAADTADGAVSGAVGAAVSGLAIAGATALGLTAGLPLTILGIVGGLGGAFLGDQLFKGTGIYGAIKGFVSKLFGG